MPGAAGQLENCSSSEMSLGIARGCFPGLILLASVLQDASLSASRDFIVACTACAASQRILTV